jgi:hypothetical protein
MESKEFEQLVLSKVPSGETFQPLVTYDADGDCIEFLTSDQSFYAEQVDPLVTVYYDRETGEVIGSLIKGISRFLREVLERAPGFKIEIQDGRIKLEHLLTARLWSAAADPKGTWVLTYQKLRAVAERSHAEAEVDDLALT